MLKNRARRSLLKTLTKTFKLFYRINKGGRPENYQIKRDNFIQIKQKARTVWKHTNLKHYGCNEGDTCGEQKEDGKNA